MPNIETHTAKQIFARRKLFENGLGKSIGLAGGQAEAKPAVTGMKAIWLEWVAL